MPSRPTHAKEDPAHAAPYDTEEEGLVHFELADEADRDDSERQDTAWLVQHYAELVEQYPFSWVAVKDRRVVGHGATPNQAMEHALDTLGDKKGHPNDENNEKRAHGKNAPHLYFLERSADWFLEH